MKKTGTMLRILAALLSVLLTVLGAVGIVSGADDLSADLAAGTAEQRVYDQAELFTDEQVETLESQIAKIQERIEGDLLIITSEDVPEDPDYDFDNSENYLRSAYESLGLREDGFAYIIDMQNRVLWTTCFGKYDTEKYRGSIPEKVYDASLQKAREGDYFGAASAFTDEVDRIGNIPRALVPTGASLLLSVVLSAAALLILIARHKTTQPSKANTPPLKVNRYRTIRHDEDYLGKSVVRTPIPKNNGSGGSRGGGGGHHSSSHGGGGHF